MADVLNKPIENSKFVVCHLGQGASICAVQNGKSVDTSMGLTPLGGIPMCARSGDLDPSVVTYIMDKENIAPKDMETMLNKESGVYGISGVSVDFRDIEAASANGDKKAELSLKHYKYIVAQFIAKYVVSMQGIDGIAFTAGVGENQCGIRKGICENLKFMGIEIDDERNKIKGEEIQISSDNSKVPVWVIPTNEELVIARDTVRLINK